MEEKDYLPSLQFCTVAIVGLGYVGLPLAIELVKKNSLEDVNRKVIGFDINQERISKLKEGNDITNEIENEELYLLQNIDLTTDKNKLKDADVFIVTVPTPIDERNKPNLEPLESACINIGEIIKLSKSSKSKIIIFESTVYPGTTEEICVPLIKKKSGLEYNKDFYCGYSPERINPGDKNHRISNIVKVTSGSDQKSSVWIDKFYSSFIAAGTHMTNNIKIAEAAKIIENTQRDLNIALINELSKIFKIMNLDTQDVLLAASTKWNFLSFNPGLVGGHCIGVDPYYLTFKAQELGYNPEVILSGRKLNDNMARWVAQELISKLECIESKNNNILILGFTFKINCPDVRNTQIEKFVKTIKRNKQDYQIDIVDNLANIADVRNAYSMNILKEIPNNKKYICIVIAVAHDYFNDVIQNQITKFLDKDGIIFDLCGVAPRRLNPWRL